MLLGHYDTLRSRATLESETLKEWYYMQLVP